MKFQNAFKKDIHTRLTAIEASPAELAKTLKVSRTTLHRWTSVPQVTDEHAERIARGLNTMERKAVQSC